MAILIFFTICFFLTAVGKNMEVLSYKYPRDQRSCTPFKRIIYPCREIVNEYLEKRKSEVNFWDPGPGFGIIGKYDY